MDDAGVKIVFKKDTHKMVRGALVLMWGVQIGTLYKLQGSTVIDGCNNFVVPESGAENLVVSGENTMFNGSFSDRSPKLKMSLGHGKQPLHAALQSRSFFPGVGRLTILKPQLPDKLSIPSVFQALSRSKCFHPMMPAKCGPVALASMPRASLPACPWSSPLMLVMLGRGFLPCRSW